MANAKRDGAAPEEVRDLRRAIEWMKKEGDMNVINKMFGWKDHADRTRKLAYAVTHPIPPVMVDQKDAAVQEEVYEKPAEANDYVVPIRHTNVEPELTVGSGNRLISGEYFNGGTDLGYNRMNFRWGNVGTFQ